MVIIDDHTVTNLAIDLVYSGVAFLPTLKKAHASIIYH